MADNSESLSRLHYDGLQVFYLVIALVLQTLFYGIHLLLIPIGLHKLMKREGKARPNMYIMFAMLVPFLLSSAFWALQFAEILVHIRIFFLEPAEQFTRSFTYYVALFNAIILVNYVVSDGVVVWRAWVLCEDEFGRLLLIPVILLALTTLSTLTTVGLRVASYLTTAGPDAGDSDPIIKAITFLQVSNLVWSFLTNFAATSVVGLKAWRYRQVLKAGLRDAPHRSTRAEHILYLLVESGFLYCISGAIVLVFSMVKLPYGTVGDIYTPMSVQVAGIYPTIVVVLIDLQRTVDHSLQWQLSAKPSRPAAATMASQTVSGHIQFARSASLYLESMSEEDLDLDLEAGAEPLPAKVNPYSYPDQTSETS